MSIGVANNFGPTPLPPIENVGETNMHVIFYFSYQPIVVTTLKKVSNYVSKEPNDFVEQKKKKKTVLIFENSLNSPFMHMIEVGLAFERTSVIKFHGRCALRGICI